MRIEEIGNTLKNLLRKQNAGTVQETVIGKAIIDAEKDLNSEGILAYKAKKYFHEIMKPFVVTEDVTFSSGIYSLPNGTISAVADLGSGVVRVSAAAHGQIAGGRVSITGTTSYDGEYTITNVNDAGTFDIIAVFVATGTGLWSRISVLELLDVQVNDSGNKWPAKIVMEPSAFRVGSLEDVTEVSEGTQIPLPLFIKELAISAGVTALPNYFVKALGGFLTLSGEDYKAVEIDPENWGSRDVKQIFGDLDSPGELNDLNIEEVEVAPGSWTDGKTPVPAGFIKLLSITSQVNSEKFDGIIVPVDKFDSRNISDMANDGELKKHLTIVPKTIALTSSKGDLPENFVLDKQMFQAGDYEGIRLLLYRVQPSLF